MSLAIGSTAEASEVPQVRTTVGSAYAALVLRVGLGVVMLAHAAAKLFIFTLPGTVGFFQSQGFPGWTAYPVVAIEAIAGLLLVIGLYSRWAAISLVPVMVGALLVHLPNGWMFNAPNGGGWEFVAFLIAALLAQALLGDGALSLGYLVARRKR